MQGSDQVILYVKGSFKKSVWAQGLDEALWSSPILLELRYHLGGWAIFRAGTVVERVTLEKGSFIVTLVQVAIEEGEIIPRAYEHIKAERKCEILVIELGKDFRPQ